MLLLSSCLFFISCKKDKDGQSTDDSKSTVIKDLAGDTGASVSDGIDGKERRPFKVFLFKLENQQQIWLNNARAYYKGAELNFSISPLPGLQISGGYQYLLAAAISA